MTWETEAPCDSRRSTGSDRNCAVCHVKPCGNVGALCGLPAHSSAPLVLNRAMFYKLFSIPSFVFLTNKRHYVLYILTGLSTDFGLHSLHQTAGVPCCLSC